MNPRQFATVAAELCGSVVLAGWVVASFAGLGSVGIENAGAISIEDRRAPSLAADAEFANAPRATAWATPLSLTPMWLRPPNR